MQCSIRFGKLRSVQKGIAESSSSESAVLPYDSVMWGTMTCGGGSTMTAITSPTANSMCAS